MSDNLYNSDGSVIPKSQYGIFGLSGDFNVPNVTAVSIASNVLPFNVEVLGTLEGMVDGVWTATEPGIYWAEWFGFIESGAESGNGAVRNSMIVKNDNRNLEGPSSIAQFFMNSTPKYNAGGMFNISIGDTLIAGLYQDSGSPLTINNAACQFRIQKIVATK